MAVPASFDITHCGPYGDDPRLAGWRANVGTPVSCDAPSLQSPPDATTLTLLSWNLWVGRGRLAEVVGRIRDGAYASLGFAAEAPLVVLAQEAYRSDGSVPARSNGWGPREFGGRASRQDDIVDVARALGLNLRYAPSMRHAAGPGDRGNAILASCPLTEAAALELPLVLQRRVTVAATLALNGHRIRLLSAHLDPRGPPGHRWLGSAGRALHTQHLLETVADDTVLLGADLNLGRGRGERSWRLLTEAGFTPGIPPVLPTWRHTYHALPRLVLDYILVRNRRNVIRAVTIHRLDEDPRDRGSTVFGSDHHPLLARIEFT